MQFPDDVLRNTQMSARDFYTLSDAPIVISITFPYVLYTRRSSVSRSLSVKTFPAPLPHFQSCNNMATFGKSYRPDYDRRFSLRSTFLVLSATIYFQRMTVLSKPAVTIVITTVIVTVIVITTILSQYKKLLTTPAKT